MKDSLRTGVSFGNLAVEMFKKRLNENAKKCVLTNDRVFLLSFANLNG